MRIVRTIFVSTVSCACVWSGALVWTLDPAAGVALCALGFAGMVVESAA